jgi:arsenate reductase (thioredoxin)
MAEAFANRYGSDILVATSAGLAPVEFVIPETVAIMGELGVDISTHVPMPYNPRSSSRYDIVVNMSGFRLPGEPPKEVLEWFVADPFRKSPDIYRMVRDEIQERVMALILQLRKG